MFYRMDAQTHDIAERVRDAGGRILAHDFGAGLLVDASDAGALERCRLIWMRIDLRPDVPAPK